MKRVFQFIVLSFAMLLVLAHAVTPHEHYNSYSSKDSEAHAKANSLLDYLALGFHHELYDGQQETYLHGEFQEVDLDELDFIAHFAALHFEILFFERVETTVHVVATSPMVKSYDLGIPILRGPPVVLS